MSIMIRRYSDVFVALFVVAIAAMLLIPLPTPLLSFLLVVNICFSLLVLLVGLYTPNVLSLLSFPTLLLLTTLFRLSLNVASARLILIQGDAGSVIRAFGTFLIRGEIVVGVIIFSIITIVNFIVIARGASRVSEVAARFALDAMPGKQMAIDSDQRAGNLTSAEAQHKRDELRRESQLYGAMDGAMKFVQGDAIAGIFIIITNIVGGIYLGVSRGLDFADALETYTILTVGDGLVTQIPALLISICAGIVVTRVSSSEGATLGSDMGAQLFARPWLLVVSGIFLVGLATFSGLPLVPFIGVGALFAGTGYLINRRRLDYSYGQPGTLGMSVERGLALPSPERAIAEGDLTEATIYLEASTLFKTFEAQRNLYSEAIRAFREDFNAQTGLNTPAILVQPRSFSSEINYEIQMDGIECDSGKIPLDALLAEISPASVDTVGVTSLGEVDHPINGAKVIWTRNSAANRKLLDAGGYRNIDFLGYILLRLGAFLSDHPEEIISLTTVHGLLKSAERRSPGLVSEVFSANFVSVPKLTETLQRLAREGISLRDFRSVLELVSSYCTASGITTNDDSGFDIDDFISYFRTNKRRQVSSTALTSRKSLKVLTLDAEVESAFEDAMQDNSRSSLAIEPASLDNMKRSLSAILEPIYMRGQLPVVILCRQDIRGLVFRFIKASGLRLAVVGLDELEPQMPLEHVGVWALTK